MRFTPARPNAWRARVGRRRRAEIESLRPGARKREVALGAWRTPEHATVGKLTCRSEKRMTKQGADGSEFRTIRRKRNSYDMVRVAGVHCHVLDIYYAHGLGPQFRCELCQ